ncbi:MAG: DEAD/DEAH box helicase, partial [Thiothrix sp.]|nr:DEAD/DEAH box helicase [Thiothrix sp.]
VYGGAGYEQQRRQFEQPVDLLIGTPGRIIDYWKQKVFTLRQAQVMVLDEADRMFDMGFIQDVRYLLRKLPSPTERLNMLFSATLSHKVLELAYEHMNSPATVMVEAQSVSADNIHEFVYLPANKEKIPLLVGLIRKLEPHRAIVFVNTKHGAERIEGYLLGNGIGAALISGDVRQKKRERLLKEFAEGRHQVLIATDVAARGLHIPDVSHVFNFDLPQIAEDYVHRIGRTARAGASGEAHSFACEDTAFYLPEIEEYIGKSIPVVAIEPVLLPALERPKRIQRERVEGGRRRHAGGGGSRREGGRDSRREHRPRSENRAGTGGGERRSRPSRRGQQGPEAPAADGVTDTAVVATAPSAPVSSTTTPTVEVMVSLNPANIAGDANPPVIGGAATAEDGSRKKRRRRRTRSKNTGDGSAPGAVAGNTPS